ncbi:MAG: signal peptidase I, partial [Clostridia bacterium]|nr:signal peptidase I [Clostridia bacterium]
MIENQAKNSKKDKILNVIFIAISVILICFMFFTVKFWISLSVVKGDSMNPSLQSGDILITNMLTTPKRGEVVVFKFDENNDYIKRVIAISGDTIYNDENGDV